MFDMSWGEIMVIGGVALIVIGPKDLPKALRTVGQMTAKVRRMAGEFQTQFNEAMREADLQDVRREVEGLNRDVANATSTGGFNPIQTIRDELRGAVEPTAASSAPEPSTEWTPGQSSLTLSPVEEPGSAAAARQETTSAVTPGDASSLGEAQPLVPLPFDEPVLPAVAAPDPSHLMTGPGLEPLVETDRAASRTSAAAVAANGDGRA